MEEAQKEKARRVLAVMPAAHGAMGGIPQLCCDVLDSLSKHPEVSSIDVLCRRSPDSQPLDAPKSVHYLSQGSYSLQAFLMAALGLSLRRVRYDAIIVAHINLLLVAALFSPRGRVPIVLMIHGIEVWNPSRLWLLKLLLNKVSLVLGVSRCTINRFLPWAGPHLNEIPCEVLPCAIDLERFTPGAKPDELISKYELRDKKVLLTLCRLDPAERYKGIDEVLEVLPELSKRYPNIAYLIAGTGEDRDRLEKKAVDLEIDERVIFLGYVEEEFKVELYRLADVFVMPGSGEGFGIVYLEAVACGIPAIGSVLDGSYEALLEGELGECVDPNYPDQLLEAIDKQLGDSSREVPSAITTFSIEAHARRLHQYLNMVFKS